MFILLVPLSCRKERGRPSNLTFVSLGFPRSVFLWARDGTRFALTALPTQFGGKFGLLGSIGFLFSGLMPVDFRAVDVMLGRPAPTSPVSSRPGSASVPPGSLP